MKANIKIRAFDAADYLGSEESIAAFVGDAMESGDSVVIQNALGTVARARGMARIAEGSGLGRESLYKALRPDAKPRFDTVLKVFSALGIKMSVEVASRTLPAPVHAKPVHSSAPSAKIKPSATGGSRPPISTKAVAKKAITTRRRNRQP